MARASHKLATAVLGVATVGILTAGGVAVVLTPGVSDTAPVEVLGTRVTADGSTAESPTDSEPAPREAPPAAGPGEHVVVPTPTSATEVPRAAGPSGDGVWAVVIGIDRYPGSYDLRAGVSDAREVDAMLGRAGVPDSRRRVLVDSDASLDAARSALDWLVDNAGPRSTAVVFFSGHVREVAGDRDGDGEDVDEAMLLADGGELLDGEVTEALEDLRARHTWIAIAGCYGGGFDDLLAPGRVLTAASPEGALAYENDRFNRTYLVEYMIGRTALAGGAGSVQDAFAQAVAALEVDYPNRLPVMFDRSGGPVTVSPS